MAKDYWAQLGTGARVGLLCGVAVILAATIGVAAWLWRVDYQVLFADLQPQDTAVMVAELDRMKVPYKIGSDGNTILVDGAVVHSTRLKLMGKDLPLHGTAGFELFNNADFGMTEFAQKINYQRALQGELTRTIMSLSEVRDARVHLALPEEGLFKRATSKAKAAITLSLKPGQALLPEQINGIQRLVSSAVPGIATQDVTIVDQQGVALTRQAAAEGEQDIGSGRLDLKRDTEALLARKATQVLERAFGAGQALASVDVTLNMDQVRVTTEDVLGTPSHPGKAPSGVMIREREVARDVGPPLGGRPDGVTGTSNNQREVEYQVGRRVEQVASQPGAIRRLQVVAVIRQPMTEEQIAQMRVLVSAAVGLVPERGDTVVVQSMRAFEPAGVRDEMAAVVPNPHPAAHVPVSLASGDGTTVVTVLAAFLFAALAAGAGVWAWNKSRAQPVLTARERQAVLEQMRGWLETAPPPQVASVAPASLGLGVRP